MQLLRETVRRAALSDRPILVVGPTGSGKELVVAAIHAQGPHPDEPLLDLNCGAIPESLMESQLFGHERGAFTGADRRQDGYFALVRKGTLFLDEIAELSLPLQAKLLRVLESGRFRPVGAAAVARFGGRVVAATHANLQALVARGLFREDLFYRLDVLTVPSPRWPSVPRTCRRWSRTSAGQQPRPLRFTAEAMDLLCCLPWPGNVRQLRNLIDRLAVFAEHDRITPEVLRPFLVSNSASSTEADKSMTSLEPIVRAILRLPVENKLAAIEEALIVEAMALCDGNKSAAARLLGVHRKAVERRVEKSLPEDGARGDPTRRSDRTGGGRWSPPGRRRFDRRALTTGASGRFRPALAARSDAFVRPRAAPLTRTERLISDLQGVRRDQLSLEQREQHLGQGHHGEDLREIFVGLPAAVAGHRRARAAEKEHDLAENVGRAPRKLLRITIRRRRAEKLRGHLVQVLQRGLVRHRFDRCQHLGVGIEVKARRGGRS